MLPRSGCPRAFAPGVGQAPWWTWPSGCTSFPDLVTPEYTLRAVNYILGTHPVSSTSYVAGVGTVSKTKTYSNNRGDNAYIPGAVIPGYIIIKPDFPECIDDFGFLWFEDEAGGAGSASWVVAGNAAAALTRETTSH